MIHPICSSVNNCIISPSLKPNTHFFLSSPSLSRTPAATFTCLIAAGEYSLLGCLHANKAAAKHLLTSVCSKTTGHLKSAPSIGLSPGASFVSPKTLSLCLCCCCLITVATAASCLGTSLAAVLTALILAFTSQRRCRCCLVAVSAVASCLGTLLAVALAAIVLAFFASASAWAAALLALAFSSTSLAFATAGPSCISRKLLAVSSFSLKWDSCPFSVTSAPSSESYPSWFPYVTFESNLSSCANAIISGISSSFLPSTIIPSSIASMFDCCFSPVMVTILALP